MIRKTLAGAALVAGLAIPAMPMAAQADPVNLTIGKLLEVTGPLSDTGPLPGQGDQVFRVGQQFDLRIISIIADGDECGGAQPYSFAFDDIHGRNGTIWGIASGLTGTTVYRNNMIRLGLNAAGSSITTGFSVIGIRDSAGATNQYYHNTVYVGGAGVISSSNSYCFLSDVVTVTRNFQDNIFWNARGNSASGGVSHLAIRVGGTAANPAGLTSNYNDLYFSGTDGATGVFNAVVVPTLASWRTATGQDVNSISADPNFTSASDLHIKTVRPITPQQMSARKGTFISGVTTDYDGDTRRTGAFPNAPDIGADEFTTYLVNSSAGAGGLISPALTNGIYNPGSNQAFTITPNGGFTIGSVTDNSVSQAAASPYNLTNITADHAVAATFTSPLSTNALLSNIALTNPATACIAPPFVAGHGGL